MGLFQVILSQIVSIIAFGMLALGLMKAFQIASELGEIKELLRDIKRNANEHLPIATSPVNLARAVNAEEQAAHDKIEQHRARLEQALKEESFPD